MEDKEKKKLDKIDDILDKINDNYEQEIVSTLDKSKEKYSSDRFLSTGSIILDYGLSGGYPFGKIIEIFGQESSGKSTLALYAVRECQKIGKIAVFLDLENWLDIKYAKDIGVDEKKLIVYYPSNSKYNNKLPKDIDIIKTEAYGEKILELVIKLINSGVGLIVLDSVSALVPKDELDSSLERHQIIGSKARMMSTALSKINIALSGSDCIIIFINQLRNKINTFSYYPGGQTTTGGLALQYYSNLRLKLSKSSEIKKETEMIGIEIKVDVVKAKVSLPSSFKIEIMFRKGIDKNREIISLAEENKLIRRNKGWYFYGDYSANGKEDLISYLEKNHDIFDKMKKELEAKEKKN